MPFPVVAAPLKNFCLKHQEHTQSSVVSASLSRYLGQDRSLDLHTNLVVSLPTGDPTCLVHSAKLLPEDGSTCTMGRPCDNFRSYQPSILMLAFAWAGQSRSLCQLFSRFRAHKPLGIKRHRFVAQGPRQAVLKPAKAVPGTSVLILLRELSVPGLAQLVSACLHASHFGHMRA